VQLQEGDAFQAGGNGQDRRLKTRGAVSVWETKLAVFFVVLRRAKEPGGSTAMTTPSFLFGFVLCGQENCSRQPCRFSSVLAQRPAGRGAAITVTERGRQRPVSKQRALVKTMTSRALKGDSRAIALLADLAMRLLPQDDETTAAKPLSADDQAILEDFDLRLREDDGPAEEEES
jgi:hypothetical protein